MTTEIREPFMLSAEQAEHIRQRFYSSPGWTKVAVGEPGFVAALDALPDETLMRRVNWMWWEMYCDVRGATRAVGGE